MNELVFVLCLVLGMLGTSALFKQWRLFFVFLTFFICFGLMEWLSVVQTGHSISQLFWIFDTAHPIKGWIIVIGMAVAWVALLVHFKVHKPKK